MFGARRPPPPTTTTNSDANIVDAGTPDTAGSFQKSETPSRSPTPVCVDCGAAFTPSDAPSSSSSYVTRNSKSAHQLIKNT